MTSAPVPWHVVRADLEAYAAGLAQAGTALSAEAHLLGCAECRGVLRDVVAMEPLEVIWSRVEEAIETPRPPVIAHVLRRLGLSASDLLVLGAATSLRGAWVLGSVIVCAFAALSVVWSSGRGLFLFLVVAPIAPVLGVAFAYGSDADPSHELTLAAPYPSVRLLLVRTVGVLAFCLPVTAIGGLFLPGPKWLAVAWLMPALAAVMTTLATSTWVAPTRSVPVITLVWVAVVTAATVREQPLSILEGRALLANAVVLVTALIVFRRRAHLLSRLGGAI